MDSHDNDERVEVGYRDTNGSHLALGTVVRTTRYGAVHVRMDNGELWSTLNEGCWITGRP